jgi:hypothetical protein
MSPWSVLLRGALLPFSSNIGLRCPSWVCAVERRRLPVGVSPARQPLQPEATGAVMEVTKWLKPRSACHDWVTARVCRLYLRKLAKHGVKLVSITQPLGDEDEPAQAMMRKVIALFDKYQSKENAKHVIRSMRENARQGFWNGATCPLGYRLVEVEKRGAKVKRSLPRPSLCVTAPSRTGRRPALGDLVVISNAQRAPPHSRGIAIVSEGKVVLGLQPAAIPACELIEWSAFNHRCSPRSVPLYHELEIEAVETHRFQVRPLARLPDFNELAIHAKVIERARLRSALRLVPFRRGRAIRIPEVRRAKDSRHALSRAHIRTASPCTGDRTQPYEAARSHLRCRRVEGECHPASLAHRYDTDPQRRCWW